MLWKAKVMSHVQRRACLFEMLQTSIPWGEFPFVFSNVDTKFSRMPNHNVFNKKIVKFSFLKYLSHVLLFTVNFIFTNCLNKFIKKQLAYIN